MKMKNSHMLSSVLFACAMMSFSTFSFSEDYQSHDSIKKSAEQYLTNILENNLQGSMTVKVTTGRLDSRLRLRQCELPLEPFLPSGSNLSGNTSIGVRCEGRKPWSLYVSAKISKYADVFVSTRFLARGIELTERDFTLKRHDISNQSHGYITDIKEIKGKILRRPLRHNTVIPPNALNEAMLVKRGDRVTILAQNSGVKVHMKGKALKNGAAGELIRVQNLSSKRIIEGRVLSAGVVAVRL